MKDEVESQPDTIEVTVTYLMMERPPALYPPLPMNRGLALLRTRNMPTHFYRYLIDRVGRKWHWVNALRLAEVDLEKKLAEPDRDIRVLYREGVPIGFFEVAPHTPGIVELVYFGLMETATGTGLGRWFLGAAVEAAWATKPERIVVQTCTLDHPAALPLYQKLGFAPVAQERETVRPMAASERMSSVMR